MQTEKLERKFIEDLDVYDPNGYKKEELIKMTKDFIMQYDFLKF